MSTSRLLKGDILFDKMKQEHEGARVHYDIETNHGETQSVDLNLELDIDIRRSSQH